jgi:ribosomal 30S subunit maturation factor RimM
LRVLSYTDPPDALLDYAHWQLQRADGSVQDCELRDAEWDGRTLRVALDGIDDAMCRDAARLRNHGAASGAAAGRTA